MLLKSLPFIFLFTVACSSQNEQPESPTEIPSESIDENNGCTEAPQEIWVSAEHVDPELRRLENGFLLEAFGVRALRGCEDISGPLAAMNWSTIDGQEGSDDYSEAVLPMLVEMGAKIIYVGQWSQVLETPDGTQPDGSPWLQAELAMPLYPSAEQFAGMIASEAWLKVGGFKLNEINPEHYDFVLQKCFFGCDAVQAHDGFFAWPAGPMLAHHFNASQATVRAAIEPLKEAIHESGLGQLHFVGYSWALPKARITELGVPEQSGNGYWNDGTILISLSESENAQAIVALDAYANFMAAASRSVMVTFE